MGVERMKEKRMKLIRDFLMITVGSMCFALAFDLFLEPSGINCGGVSGIAMLVVYATQSKFLTVGILSAMINIPLFFFGFRKIGKHFFFGSLLSTVISAFCLDLFKSCCPFPRLSPWWPRSAAVVCWASVWASFSTAAPPPAAWILLPGC